MRRAISTAYYALFHCTAKSCADLLIGGDSAQRSQEAWTQVYRSLAHGAAKDACSKNTISKFPRQIQDFASQFVAMRKKRQSADYDPDAHYFKSSVLNDIAACEAAIRDFASAPIVDRRAFAAWVLFKTR